MGHDGVPTTFLSYGAVAPRRQGQIIQSLVLPGGRPTGQAEEIAQAVLQAMRGAGFAESAGLTDPNAGFPSQPGPQGSDERPRLIECQVEVTKPVLADDGWLTVNAPSRPTVCRTRCLEAAIRNGCFRAIRT